MVTALEKLFPRLRPGTYQATSASAASYNCIAWAAGVSDRWWWPELDPENGYWPAAVPAVATIAALAAAFATLGYTPGATEEHEPGWEKVALFADKDGTPTHAARQLPDGRWTSKIGKLEDIVHDLHDLTGLEYGTVVEVMKRPATFS